MAYPVPQEEDARLEELRSFDILDSAPEQAYDDLCLLASHICETSIAAITLIDEDRQWFKAEVGIDADETRREDAFCAHAIVQPDEVMVVEDATQDDRFRDNPFVEDDPEIRFYAGAPLKTSEGRGLGTICAIDDEPRELTDDQRRGLEALSRQVMAQLEMRRKGTRLRDAKQEIEEIAEELRRSNDELDRFASVVSHELKDPLTQVVSSLDLLDHAVEDALDDEARELLDTAIVGGDRMESLIKDLLQYARAGRDLSELQPVDLDRVAGRVRDELRRRLEAEDAQLEVDELPTVRGDASLLRQVLQNLVGNALKYHGDEPPRIRIRAGDARGMCRIAVEDEGPGIPEDEQERLFHVFERGSNTGDREGTGVGLALCKRIVDRHGGRIGVESTPGEGSVFWFTLERAADEPSNVGT